MSDAPKIAAALAGQSGRELEALLSHNARNPLSAIKWSSEMLIDGDAGQLNQEQLRHVLAISESHRRLSEVLDAILLLMNPDPDEETQPVQNQL